eukprot:5127354-Pyramimonas_sp.AAC.1
MGSWGSWGTPRPYEASTRTKLEDQTRGQSYPPDDESRAYLYISQGQGEARAAAPRHEAHLRGPLLRDSYYCLTTVAGTRRSARGCTAARSTFTRTRGRTRRTS